LFGVDEFVFHRFKEIVIKLEAHFQSTIGYALVSLEQCEYLGEDVIEGHEHSSNASKSAFASFKSAVSKPSVNQLYTGASRSWASWRLPCWCQRRARLVAILNSKDFAC